MALMRRVLVEVSGRVQGVFFRSSCVERARALGLAGWIRNADDGRVEAAFEGAAPAVQAMIEWCESGPPAARVERISVRDEPPTGGTGFRVVR
ncbi:MAG: acylphosphatase [Actinomycetota bacterium]